MLTIRQEPQFAVVTVAGTVTPSDYETFVPEFERIARDWQKVPMLIDATALESWELSVLWPDLKFSAAHKDSFGPMAIVGDRKWMEWGTAFSKPFFDAEMRFFRPEEREDARRWLLTRAKAAA